MRPMMAVIARQKKACVVLLEQDMERGETEITQRAVMTARANLVAAIKSRVPR